ncbi:hypothetical protein MHYP_G00146380 [Metynnis hypsauchen]
MMLKRQQKEARLVGDENIVKNQRKVYILLQMVKEKKTKPQAAVKHGQLTIMATRRQARIPEDLARDMILNGWDEVPIGGTDSGSDISDVEDPEYCPSGHVRHRGVL